MCSTTGGTATSSDSGRGGVIAGIEIGVSGIDTGRVFGGCASDSNSVGDTGIAEGRDGADGGCGGDG